MVLVNTETGLLLLGGLLLFATAKESTPQRKTAEVFNSPTGQEAQANIEAVYGDSFADTLREVAMTTTTAGDAFRALGYVSPPDTNTPMVETFTGVWAYDTEAVGRAPSPINPYANESQVDEWKRKIKVAQTEIRRQDRYKKSGVLSGPRQKKVDSLNAYIAQIKKDASASGVYL